ncbi:hypothetical protein [Thalassococcus sp. S3]|uniref:hypothetical protein n=1 Tax=Thalassococcus sp. S3 TaxID=2017482 RepID=UPI0010244B1F|nr:hypothetical protein [Thalassococcus sp. S3]QBF31911.1 hypothetical protein CFI11_11865 [Thalassococcus sp. S3]
MKIEKKHLDHILTCFQNELCAIGFSRRRKDYFDRKDENGLIYSVEICFSRRNGLLNVTPYLRVLHEGIGSLLTEVFASDPDVKKRKMREFHSTLLIERVEPRNRWLDSDGSLLERVMHNPFDIYRKLPHLIDELRSELASFISAQPNLTRIIQNLEEQREAGDCRHEVTLFALYYYTGREADVKKLAQDLRMEERPQPVAIEASDFFLRKTGETNSQFTELLSTQNDEIPHYPLKLSREERTKEKERGKAFSIALKSKCKGSGWRYNQGHISRQDGDWFISVDPSLAYEKGVIVDCELKPMAVDPLYWEIMGLDENKSMPLSSRIFAAWRVFGISHRAHIERLEHCPEAIAESVLRWSTLKMAELVELSVEDILVQLKLKSSPMRTDATLGICLLILLDRLDEAENIARYHMSQIALSPEGSTFAILSGEDGYGSFFKRACNWIAKKRRGGFQVIH